MNQFTTPRITSHTHTRFSMPVGRTVRAMRFTCAATLAAGALACSTSSASEPTTEPPVTNPATDISQYYITPTLCTDASGPDCTKLRLGDTHLSTTGAAIGKLFSCTGANASAPGSVRSRITWIDDATGSWNLLRKPFLPARTGTITPGTIAVTEQSGSRTIVASSYPVDAKIGAWPMTTYALLTAIDGNPGTPAQRTVSFTLPMLPTVVAVAVR